MRNAVKYRPFLSSNQDIEEADPLAENMLVYQRAIGGWPKAVNEIKVDYNKALADAEKKLSVQIHYT